VSRGLQQQPVCPQSVRSCMPTTTYVAASCWPRDSGGSECHSPPVTEPCNATSSSQIRATTAGQRFQLHCFGVPWKHPFVRLLSASPPLKKIPKAAGWLLSAVSRSPGRWLVADQLPPSVSSGSSWLLPVRLLRWTQLEAEPGGTLLAVAQTNLQSLRLLSKIANSGQTHRVVVTEPATASESSEAALTWSR
jgi:hypothetical protein